MEYDPSRRYLVPWNQFVTTFSEERLYWDPLLHYAMGMVEQPLPQIGAAIDTAIRGIIGVMPSSQYASVDPERQAGFTWLMLEAHQYDFEQYAIPNPLYRLLKPWIRASRQNAMTMVHLACALWHYLRAHPHLWVDADRPDPSHRDVLLMDRSVYQAYTALTHEFLLSYPFLQELFVDKALYMQIQMEHRCTKRLFQDCWAWMLAQQPAVHYVAERAYAQIPNDPSLFEQIIITPQDLLEAGVNLQELVQSNTLQRYINSAALPAITDPEKLYPIFEINGHRFSGTYPHKLMTHADQIQIQCNVVGVGRYQLRYPYAADDEQCYPITNPYQFTDRNPKESLMNPNFHYQNQAGGIPSITPNSIPNITPYAAPPIYPQQQPALRRTFLATKVHINTPNGLQTYMAQPNCIQQLSQSQLLVQFPGNPNYYPVILIGDEMANVTNQLGQPQTINVWRSIMANPMDEADPTIARYFKESYNPATGQLVHPQQQQVPVINAALDPSNALTAASVQQIGPNGVVQQTVVPSANRPTLNLGGAHLPQSADQGGRMATQVDWQGPIGTNPRTGEVITIEMVMQPSFDFTKTGIALQPGLPESVVDYVRELRIKKKAAQAAQETKTAQAATTAAPKKPEPAKVVPPAPAPVMQAAAPVIVPAPAPAPPPAADDVRPSEGHKQKHDLSDLERMMQQAKHPDPVPQPAMPKADPELLKRMKAADKAVAEKAVASPTMQDRRNAGAKSLRRFVETRIKAGRKPDPARLELIDVGTLTAKLLANPERGLNDPELFGAVPGLEIIKEPVSANWHGDANPLLDEEEQKALLDMDIDRVDVHLAASRMDDVQHTSSVGTSLSYVDLFTQDETADNRAANKSAPAPVYVTMVDTPITTADNPFVVQDFCGAVINSEILTIKDAQNWLTAKLDHFSSAANDVQFNAELQHSRDVRDTVDPSDVENVFDPTNHSGSTKQYLSAVDTLLSLDRVLTDKVNDLLKHRLGLNVSINSFLASADDLSTLTGYSAAHAVLMSDTFEPDEGKDVVEAAMATEQVRAMGMVTETLTMEVVHEIGRTMLASVSEGTPYSPAQGHDGDGNPRTNTVLTSPMVTVALPVTLSHLGLELPRTGVAIPAGLNVGSMLFKALASRLLHMLDLEDVDARDRRPLHFDFYVRCMGGDTVRVVQNPLSTYLEGQEPFMASLVNRQ